jgi:hypothetical protein
MENHRWTAKIRPSVLIRHAYALCRMEKSFVANIVRMPGRVKKRLPAIVVIRRVRRKNSLGQ